MIFLMTETHYNWEFFVIQLKNSNTRDEIFRLDKTRAVTVC